MLPARRPCRFSSGPDSIGLFLATVWSAITGQSAAAGIYGIFGGFYLSYAVLGLGIIHGWFGLGPVSVVDTEKVFLISWLIIVTMLILGDVAATGRLHRVVHAG